ncbi:hypothetical protein V8C42DRAFT_356317 [Trichoderma barbatum]
MARQAEVHFYHHDTPKKARVKGAVAFAQRQKERYSHSFSYNEIFQSCQVSKTRGYEIKILTQEDLDKIEKLLWSEGFEARCLTYAQLVTAAGIDKEVSPRTQRVEFARKSLELRPAKEDYRDIIYSDEWHAACGDDRQVYILRKPGERYCPDCLYERPSPRLKDEEKFNAHFWGGIGYDFKSDLYEYRISTNNNGKMTAAYYRDHILQKVVKPWLDQGMTFILEEDRDSSHRARVTVDYKKKNGIRNPHTRTFSAGPTSAAAGSASGPTLQLQRRRRRRPLL